MSEVNRTVVKVSTQQYRSGTTLALKKVITLLKRKSCGWTVFEDDTLEERPWFNIINLETAEDGVYQVEACNFSKDWETGTIDDWNYRLEPYVVEDK